MRKILFILFTIFSICCNAQIYNTIKYYDKFDDIIKTERVKTLINIGEIKKGNGLELREITIETKGKPIETYISINCINIGRKDSIVNLVEDIYGYQMNYYCFNEKDSVYFINEILIPFYTKCSTNEEMIEDLKEMYEISDKQKDFKDFCLSFIGITFQLYISKSHLSKSLLS